MSSAKTNNPVGDWSFTDSSGKKMGFNVSGIPTNLKFSFLDGGKASGTFNSITGEGDTFTGTDNSTPFDKFKVTGNTWVWGKYGTYSRVVPNATHNPVGDWSLIDGNGKKWGFNVSGSSTNLKFSFTDGGKASGTYNPLNGDGETFTSNGPFDSFNVSNDTFAWEKYGTYNRVPPRPEEKIVEKTQTTDLVQTIQKYLYTDLGCWNDREDRAISGGYVGYPGTDAYNPSRCYDLAKSRGHNIFAVQADFACFTGIEMRDNYKKYGGAPQGDCGASGGPWINRVYKISSTDVVVPHEVSAYGDWSSIPNLFSDFQTQSSALINSLSTPDTSNPAPYMTALDTNVNAIRDSIKIQQLKEMNSKNMQGASEILRSVTDVSPQFKESKQDSERLRREITLSTNQSAAYQGKMLPLQILAGTLAAVLVIYFFAGFVLSQSIASILALVILAAGFGAAVYFAFNKQSASKNNGR